MVSRDTNIIVVFKLSREIFLVTLYFLKLIDIHKIDFCLGSRESDITTTSYSLLRIDGQGVVSLFGFS